MDGFYRRHQRMMNGSHRRKWVVRDAQLLIEIPSWESRKFESIPPIPPVAARNWMVGAEAVSRGTLLRDKCRLGAMKNP